jgi:hypothetical protein
MRSGSGARSQATELTRALCAGARDSYVFFNAETQRRREAH